MAFALVEAASATDFGAASLARFLFVQKIAQGEANASLSRLRRKLPLEPPNAHASMVGTVRTVQFLCALILATAMAFASMVPVCASRVTRESRAKRRSTQRSVGAQIVVQTTAWVNAKVLSTLRVTALVDRATSAAPDNATIVVLWDHMNLPSKLVCVTLPIAR